MSRHLLAINIGPVQTFIEAARRTRDLWFGSYVLSEISKAVAKCVRRNDGILIFPAPETDEDLERDSVLSVANIILCELDEGVEPEAIARLAKVAAQTRWREFADRVYEAHQSCIDQEIWDDQVDDVIEFSAAWYPYQPEQYQKGRAAVMRLLGSRKLCRDFLPVNGKAGVPKSSLDGRRESVLRKGKGSEPRKGMRLQEGEELDVVGVVKRSWVPKGGGQPRYPSVARVAADPWLRRLDEQDLQKLIQECESLSGVVYQVDTSTQRGSPNYAKFPFEGTVVFRSRYREFVQETGIGTGDLDRVSELVGQLAKKGEPSPYLCVLVADGDKMGEAISKLESADAHRRLSSDLSKFAGRARQIVSDHHGVLVYAGGDDVLAFVPVDQCLECARALHESFAEALKPANLTLSVGLAIAHFMEPLEVLLGYGRDAEKHAKKPDRDGLAVHVLKRGGGPVKVRGRWLDGLDERLSKMNAWLNDGAVPGRVAYDLRQIAAHYQGWPEETVCGAIQKDTLAILAGKQPAEAGGMDAIEQLVKDQVKDSATLIELSEYLLVARQLGAQ